MQLLLLTLSIVTIAARPAVDVEKTVLQVQSILQANSQLPRLTRQEILDLLNDIKAEDAKSTISSEHASTEKLTTTTASSKDNKIDPTTAAPDLTDNLVTDERESYVSAAGPAKTTVESTTKPQPTLTVVLPYTPRDGSSLQELYTRPPRTEVVALPKTTPKPPKVHKNKKLEQTLKDNHDLALENLQENFPAELQAFLDSHGLKSNSGEDHFLLPLDGFKPLPPAKIVDGTVQLPENILLTYDLISPSVEFNSSAITGNQALNNYLYDPLRPEFELDMSESQKVTLPLDLPKSRKTKSSNSETQPLLEPFDYDSFKVIPLGQGPSPVEETKGVLGSEQSKRQANSTEDVETSTTTTAATDLKDDSGVSDNAASSADADSGASISDLEESFGGAAPEKPGDSELPPPRRNGFYWMVDWNSFLEVGDGDTKVNIRFEPKLGDPQMFLPVSVP